MNEPKLTQKQRILNTLKDHYTTGVTNITLNSICFRYAARINDLRNDGYIIESKKSKGSVWIFYYIGRTV